MPRSPTLQLARSRVHPRARKSLVLSPHDAQLEGLAASWSAAATGAAAPAATATGSCSNQQGCSGGDALSTLESHQPAGAVHTATAQQQGVALLPYSLLLGADSPPPPPGPAPLPGPQEAGASQGMLGALPGNDAYTQHLQQQLAAARAQVAALQAQMVGAAAGGLLPPQPPLQQEGPAEQGPSARVADAQQDGCGTPTRNVARAIATSANGGSLQQQHQQPPLPACALMHAPLQVSVRAPRPHQPLHPCPAREAVPACTPTPTQQQQQQQQQQQKQYLPQQHAPAAGFHLEASTPTRHASLPLHPQLPLLSPPQALVFSPGLVRPGLHACKRKVRPRSAPACLQRKVRPRSAPACLQRKVRPRSALALRRLPSFPLSSPPLLPCTPAVLWCFTLPQCPELQTHTAGLHRFIRIAAPFHRMAAPFHGMVAPSHRTEGCLSSAMALQGAAAAPRSTIMPSACPCFPLLPPSLPPSGTPAGMHIHM